MASEHTPGPWKHDGQGMYICDSAGNMVAEVRGWGHLSVMLGEERAFEVQRANGDLISAAPDLLDALEECYSWMACECGHPACKPCKATKLAKAAIARAIPKPAEGGSGQ